MKLRNGRRSEKTEKMKVNKRWKASEKKSVKFIPRRAGRNKKLQSVLTNYSVIQLEKKKV